MSKENIIKDYFAAGLMVEEAREKREQARTDLRDAAAVKCPEELRRLDAASDELHGAEEHFGKIMMAIMTGRGANAAGARQFAIDHAASCDMPNCPVKANLAAEKADAEGDGKKLN